LVRFELYPIHTVRAPSDWMETMVFATPLIVSTICRSALLLFELVVDDETNEPVHPTNTAYYHNNNYPLKDAVYIPYHGLVGQLSFH
jgi:hypothetical protein